MGLNASIDACAGCAGWEAWEILERWERCEKFEKRVSLRLMSARLITLDGLRLSSGEMGVTRATLGGDPGAAWVRAEVEVEACVFKRCGRTSKRGGDRSTWGGNGAERPFRRCL